MISDKNMWYLIKMCKKNFSEKVIDNIIHVTWKINEDKDNRYKNICMRYIRTKSIITRKKWELYEYN